MMFEKIILVIIVVLQSAVVWFANKVDKASDAFFEKKAENLATKQDIADITRKTEEVQNEFKRNMTVFEQDLDYQHKLFEIQYNSLYSRLFYLICQSEALRYVKNKTENELQLYFETCPIVEEQSGESIIDNIVKLVDQNIAYATPKLVMLCSIYKSAISTNYEDIEEIQKRMMIESKKEIVNTVIEDYINLRKKLKLESQMNIPMVQGTVFEVLMLEKGSEKR